MNKEDFGPVVCINTHTHTLSTLSVNLPSDAPVEFGCLKILLYLLIYIAFEFLSVTFKMLQHQ